MGKSIGELTEREKLDECLLILQEAGTLDGKPTDVPQKIDENENAAEELTKL